jgi:hypothetical protein
MIAQESIIPMRTLGNLMLSEIVGKKCEHFPYRHHQEKNIVMGFAGLQKFSKTLKSENVSGLKNGVIYIY